MDEQEQEQELDLERINMITSITRPEIKEVRVSHGTEGPKEDPYSYTNYIIEGIKLHVGLGTSLTFSIGNTKLGTIIGDSDFMDAQLICYFESKARCSIEEIEFYQNSIYIEDPMGKLSDYE